MESITWKEIKCKRSTRPKEICDEVKSCSQPLRVDLKELAESQCDELAPALAEALAAHPTLEMLSVAAREFPDNAGQELVRGVCRSQSLKIFTLKADYLAEDTVFALADGLADGAATLEGVAISGSFSEDGLGPVFQDAVTKSSTLQSLCLEGDRIGDEIGSAIASALASGSKLRELTIHGDEVSDATCVALASALLNNSSLLSLKLEGPAIGDIAGSALAETLHSNNTLVLLEIFGGNVSDSTGNVLAAMLAMNKTLKSLAVQAIRSTGLASAGCQAFAKTLAENDTLQVLDVTASGLGDCDGLADMIRRNRALRSLTIRGQIKDSGCKLLAAALHDNRALAAFHLHDHSLTAESIRPLANAFQSNPLIMWSQITVQGWPSSKVKAALERNRELPNAWRHIAMLAKKSEGYTIKAAVDSMTEQGFRLKVFSFFMPPRRNSSLSPVSVV